MTKDGFGVIITIILFSIILTIGSCITGKTPLIVFTIISWLLTCFSFYFFRDPVRKIPNDNNLILSPADGKIIAIEKEYEPIFLKQEVTKLSIFLSIFDVHINRVPINGEVTHFDYIRGKFYPAFKNKASSDNEQTVIGIEGTHCKILLKQISE